MLKSSLHELSQDGLSIAGICAADVGEVDFAVLAAELGLILDEIVLSLNVRFVSVNGAIARKVL